MASLKKPQMTHLIGVSWTDFSNASRQQNKPGCPNDTPPSLFIFLVKGFLVKPLRLQIVIPQKKQQTLKQHT